MIRRTMKEACEECGQSAGLRCLSDCPRSKAEQEAEAVNDDPELDALALAESVEGA